MSPPVPGHAGPGPGEAPAFAPRPAHGRVFTASRAVRSTEVTPDGRLRLDALARYLQEAAEDDLADAGWREPYAWLVRRVTVTVRGYPALGEPLRLSTFCSGTGPRWAGRTTTVTGPRGDLIQAVAVWAAVGRSDGRPVPLGAAFHRMYGEAAQGRTVSARLSHPGPPPGARNGRPWPLRASDFDTAGHVNNAVHWAAVEDVLAGARWRPARAELEYHRPILPGHDPSLVASQERDHLCCWLMDGGRRLASARLRAPARPGERAAGKEDPVEQPQLRLGDCPAAEVSVVIAAPPRAVWPLVSDIQLPARFSSEFRGGEWLDGATGPALGARFKGRNHHPARGEWESESTICEYQPERRLGWAVGDPGLPAARWRFILEPEAGGTRLIQWVQLGPGPSGISVLIESMPGKESRILRRRLAEHRANMEATIAGIKALAESGSAG